MPLEGIRVVEAATLFAAPLAAMLLGDYGADVIKIEHPTASDPARGHGPSKDGVGLWFKALARNKRLVTLDLSQARRAPTSSCASPSARTSCSRTSGPGTLERWGVGWDELSAVESAARARARERLRPDRPVRRSAPGFGTLAEAMSGFAALNGEPDGPPLLPPLALADGVAGARDRVRDHGRAARARADRPRPGRRHLAGRAAADAARPAADRLRPARRAAAAHGQPLEPQRAAQRLPDGRRRLGRGLVERDLDRGPRAASSSAGPTSSSEPWFATGSGRAEHVDEIDDAVAAWIGERDRDEVLAAFEAAGGGDRAGLRRARRARRPAARGARLDQHRRGPAARAAADAERDQPALRDARARSATRAARHGADTAAVFAELGVEADELAHAPRRPGRMTVPPLTWLYVPADRPDRVEKAIASARARGDRRPRGRRRAGREGGGARRASPSCCSERRRKPVYVRVNAGDAADLEAVAGARSVSGIVVPEGRPARGRARRLRIRSTA